MKYGINMPRAKTAISLRSSLLKRVDEIAAELSLPRSGVLALAAEDFVERHDNAQLLAQLNEAYAVMPDAEERRLARAHRWRRRQGHPQ